MDNPCSFHRKLLIISHEQSSSLHALVLLYNHLQEKPAPSEIRKDRPQGQAGKEVYGVRLGAKDRSYLVRDKQIEVLKNTYGGVKVLVIKKWLLDTVAPKLCKILNTLMNKHVNR